MSSSKKTIVVGMSGGVDSSVAALLLKEQGYDVIGMFMKNWEEKDAQGVCRSSLDYEDALKVCDQLQIPCYSVNFVKEYWDSVFAHFLEELKLGYTPNPDILCNREIKFKVFLEKAMSLEADFLATGHYSQIQQIGNKLHLVKGADSHKDQSYFLYTLHQEALQKVLFPIGAYEKSEIRKIAEKNKLATYAKKDSTGICFIGKRDMKEFLSRYIPFQPGNFENLNGEVIGQHDGVAYYTLGQRKGLKIGGRGDAWFVIDKDVARNVVIIDQGTDHPALYCDTLIASDLSWISGTPPSPLPYHCKAKVRYRQADQECVITRIENGHAHVSFAKPQRAVTPRQSIVFYENDICLGGGMILKPGC
jgi:tRNA-uridine 2-sulfurtransferase